MPGQSHTDTQTERAWHKHNCDRALAPARDYNMQAWPRS